ncbi:MAG: phosphatase PAP2 family protein [Microcella sp.]|uniref:phosphatase PAP2 family protein n=1 Tax=Microcella sp. TaxID=1913979 RepID=UPI00271C2080|nr:phosphatase PAP2 family protein [Microcella sp.]MDO8338258.1 phosphatase PAP2 family protein [Microcella sp.]
MEPTTTRRVANHWPWISGVVALGVAAALGLLVVLRESPLDLDAEWMDDVLAERVPSLQVLALLMDRLGGGPIGIFVVPLGLVALLLIARRPWGALFSIIAAALSAGAVQLLKSLFARARPEDILVIADFGSFPSGHVANAATLATTIVLLFGLTRSKAWVWMLGAGWIIAMALSRTYLGAHWVTDTIGGALIGIAVAVIVWAPFASRLEREPRPSKKAPQPTGAAATPLTPADGAPTLGAKQVSRVITPAGPARTP